MDATGLVHSGLATGVLEAALLLWFLACASILGDALVRRVVPPDTAVPDRLVFASGVGLGSLGFLTLLLGSVGLFHVWLFRSLLGILSIYAAVRLFAWSRQLGIKRPARAGEHPGTLLATLCWLAAALGVFALGIGLVAALGPETEFDALNHHLGTVRLFLIAHGIVQTPSMAWAAHPLLVEMLYAFAWLACNQLFARLVHFGFGLLTALACCLFCRRYLSAAAGWLSAAVFVCSPIVLYLLQSAYIDLGLAFFSFLSAWAFFNCLQTRHKGWLLLSGILAGLSMGTKYFGAVAPVSLVTYWVWMLVRSRLHRGQSDKSRFSVAAWMGRLVPFVVASLIVTLPWLLKNLVLFGNPVAPFLADRIPTNFLAVADYRQLSALTSTWGGLTGGIVDYLRSPWLLTFKPEIFVGSIGPVFLLFVPLALLLGLRNRVIRYMGFCTLIQYVLIVTATRNVRYFVVILPLLSVLLAGGLLPTRSLSRLRCLVASAVLAVCFLQLPWFLPLWEDHPSLALSTGKLRMFTSDEERSRHLDLWLGPGSAQMHRFLDRNLPAQARVLALTPVYQAMTDRIVVMAPNSALSSRLSLQAIDAARAAAGLRIVQLDLGQGGMANQAIFWRIRLASPLEPGFEPVVRFFYRESMALEIPIFDRRVQTSPAESMILVDLGTERRVDQVQIWLPARLAGRSLVVESSNGPGALLVSRVWQPVASRRKISPERALSPQNLIDEMKNFSVLHVVLQEVPSLHFLASFFEQRNEDFRELAAFGNYRVYEIRDP